MKNFKRVATVLVVILFLVISDGLTVKSDDINSDIDISEHTSDSIVSEESLDETIVEVEEDVSTEEDISIEDSVSTEDIVNGDSEEVPIEFEDISDEEIVDDEIIEDPVEETVIENVSFNESVQIDNVLISVSAGEGVFPEGAILSVVKVELKDEEFVEEYNLVEDYIPELVETSEDELVEEQEEITAEEKLQEVLNREIDNETVQQINDVVSENRAEDKKVAISYTYDIKVFDSEGNEIQPKGNVSVKFSLVEKLNDILNVDVYHIDDDLNVETLETSVSENIDFEDLNTDVEVETESFSYYTVEFTYGEIVMSIPGDSIHALEDILEELNLVGNIENVIVSDTNLFDAYLEDEVWYVEAKQAFRTQEWMIVTLDGIDYELVVTDDGDSSITFSSNSSFTVKLGPPSGSTQYWNGTVEYSTNNVNWYTYNINTVITAVLSNGKYYVHFRGTGNSHFATSSSITRSSRFTFTGNGAIACDGNIEALLDYKTAQKANHPTMDDYCFMALFYDAVQLVSPPQFWSPTLTNYCYYYMFSGASISISTTRDSFHTQEVRIPTSGTGTTATNSTRYMFNMTSPTINTTYYVVPASFYYNLSYNVDGGSSISSVMTYQIPDPLPITRKTNYALAGWYTDEYFDNKAIAGAGLSGDTTLYAKWVYGNTSGNVRYAVQLYGIEEDIDENGDVMGLTFGPALGKDYSTQVGVHSPTGFTASGNRHRCIHNDSWPTIISYNNSDPYVYEQCIEEGCTHSVELNLNSTLANSSFTVNYYGDGPSMLYRELLTNNANFQHLQWNPLQSTNSIDYGNNVGGWGASRIRAMLNGSDNLTQTGTNYATNATGNLLPLMAATDYNSGNSLFSCFPTVLQDAIGRRETHYSDVYNSNHDAITYDRLFLLSQKEISNPSVSLRNNEGAYSIGAASGTLTIPSSMDVNSSSLVNYTVDAGTLNMSVSSDSNYKLSNGTSQLRYSMSETSWSNIQSSGNKSISFSLLDNPTEAGNYTDTLTFTYDFIGDVEGPNTYSKFANGTSYSTADSSRIGYNMNSNSATSGTKNTYWLRSPYTDNEYNVYYVKSTGLINSGNYGLINYSIAPAFALKKEKLISFNIGGVAGYASEGYTWEELIGGSGTLAGEATMLEIEEVKSRVVYFMSYSNQPYLRNSDGTIVYGSDYPVGGMNYTYN